MVCDTHFNAVYRITEQHGSLRVALSGLELSMELFICVYLPSPSSVFPFQVRSDQESGSLYLGHKVVASGSLVCSLGTTTLIDFFQR